MKDERVLAYLNLYAILGSLPRLCELDGKARELIAGEQVSLGISVKNGPEATLYFDRGVCRMQPTLEACDIKLPFSSCARFNGMIDGTVTPIPSKGFTRIGFLTKHFVPLTDRLSAYLRPDEASLEDEAFFAASTRLMFYLITEAVAQLGNEDRVSRASASYITDGAISLAIGGSDSAAILCRDHRLTALHEPQEGFSSFMAFQDLKTARALFDGKLNAAAAVGAGQVRIGGMISQVDNVNRILDRVSVYLA